MPNTLTTLDAEDAGEIAFGESFDQYTFVAKQEVSKHRWFTKQLIVFKDGDTLLGFHYLDPATEMQEGQERFEADPVPVFSVVGKDVTTTVYEAA